MPASVRYEYQFVIGTDMMEWEPDQYSAYEEQMTNIKSVYNKIVNNKIVSSGDVSVSLDSIERVNGSLDISHWSYQYTASAKEFVCYPLYANDSDTYSEFNFWFKQSGSSQRQSVTVIHYSYG